jgi:hypothetical protein
MKWKIWHYHGSVAEDSGLPGCDAVSKGVQFMEYLRHYNPLT